MSSRANLSRPAVRRSTPARLMLSGVAGTGKTRSGIEIARELVGPEGTVHVIDTEEGSALLYADELSFSHLDWQPPYDPRELGDTVLDLARGGLDVAVVIDSATHFWIGEGGTLDIADGKFGGWKTATPAQDRFVKAVLRAPCHVIVCVREKVAYEVSDAVNKNGAKSQSVSKIGLAPQQRDGLDYEFQVAATFDTDHNMTITKTRCRELDLGRVFRAHDHLAMARTYAEWLRAGVAPLDAEIVDSVKAVFAAIDDPEERVKAKRAFVEWFGVPDSLLVHQRDEIVEWLNARAATAAVEPSADPVVSEPQESENDGETSTQAEPDAVDGDDGSADELEVADDVDDVDQAALDALAGAFVDLDDDADADGES